MEERANEAEASLEREKRTNTTALKMASEREEALQLEISSSVTGLKKMQRQLEEKNKKIESKFKKFFVKSIAN